MINIRPYAHFIILSGMYKQIGKAQVLKGDVITSGDYEQGLRVLAKIIARLHLEKTGSKKEDGGTHETRKR